MLSKKIAKLIADIGLMASAAGLPKHAFGIYRGLEHTGETKMSTIGVALEFINRRRYKDSIDILQKQLKKTPDQEELKVFLGMALLLSGHKKESENLLSELAISENKPVQEMSRELIKDIYNS